MNLIDVLPYLLPLALLAVIGCQGDGRAGTLEGGRVAIGGDTTGWALLTDAGPVEVDVSAVRADADRLAGQHVTVFGDIVDRTYVERGNVPTLVATKIVARASQ